MVTIKQRLSMNGRSSKAINSLRSTKLKTTVRPMVDGVDAVDQSLFSGCRSLRHFSSSSIFQSFLLATIFRWRVEMLHRAAVSDKALGVLMDGCRASLWKELAHENDTQSDLGRHDRGVATSRWARTDGQGKAETRPA